MQLKELLFGVSIESVFGTTSVLIDHVTADSRQVDPNALFVAIRGEFHDGHSHIGDAVKRGAVAILCSFKLCAVCRIFCCKLELNHSAGALVTLNDCQDLSCK